MLLKTSQAAEPNNKGRNKGFTLIEICIAIIVLGLLITPLFRLYDTYLIEKKLNATQRAIEVVTGEMETYKNVHGAYPCPSAMDAARNDAANGRAFNNNVCDAAFFAAIPQIPGECLNGVCLKSSVRPTTSDIIIGTVPFRDLQMIEQDALDGYGNRLLYAVTQDLTNVATFNSEAGGISIIDSAANKMVANDSAMFVLLSFGASKQGGYNKNGLQTTACPTVGPEVNNCIDDFNNSTIPADAIFSYAPITTAPGANSYDHVMQFHTTKEQRLWRRYTGNEQDAQDLSPDDRVGIGTDTPVSTVDIRTEVAASGDNIASLLIAEGELAAPEICDEAGNYCFDPKIIAGDATVAVTDPSFGGLRCPNDGEYMIGIKNGQPVCGPHRFECPPDKIFNGFKADGSLNCVSEPGNSCPPLTSIVCSPVETGKDFKFGITGQSTDGFSTTLLDFGSCAKDGYRCDNGAWVRLGGHQVSASRCDFTATTTTLTGLDCGPDDRFGTQTYDQTTTTRCDGSNDVTRTPCICGEDETGTPLPPTYEYKRCDQIYSNSSVIAAPAYFFDAGGTAHEVRRERNWTGTNSCTNATSPWDLKNCECSVPNTGLTLGDTPWWSASDTRPAKWVANGSCPSGTSGTRLRLQYFNPNISSCKWGWTSKYDYSGCTCSGTDGDTREINLSGANNGCGSGNWLAGSRRYQPQTFSTATCSWQNTGPAINACNCDTTPVTGTQPHACGDPTCERPNPLLPDDIETAINPSTCLPTGGITITATGACEPRLFLWDQVGSKPGNASTPPTTPRYVDGTCGCGDEGSTKTCYQSGDNTWKRYECTCRAAN
jgi:prepilin-type N-terminal cleavage/methylation domain-containing protein